MGEGGEERIDENKVVRYVDVKVGRDLGHGEVRYVP